MPSQGSPADAPSAPPAAEAPVDLTARRRARGWRAALRREIRRHLFAYVSIAAFMVLGPILTWMIFPEASLLLGIGGGIVFGLFFAFCAVPDKIFE
jgi:hypothetical protein